MIKHYIKKTLKKLIDVFGIFKNPFILNAISKHKQTLKIALSVDYETFVNNYPTKPYDENRDDAIIIIVFPSNLGDYVLIRVFIRELYKQNIGNCKIILICNSNTSSFISHFDTKLYHKVLILGNPYYPQKTEAFQILKTLRNYKVNEVLTPIYSIQLLEYFNEIITKHISCDKKTTFLGDQHLTLSENLSIKKSTRFYNNLIRTTPTIIFEYQRYEEFFTQIGIKSKSILAGSLSQNPIKTKQIVIAPGAATKNRIWSPQKFGALIRSLAMLNTTFKIIGAEHERILGEQIIEETKGTKLKVINTCGQLNLKEFVSEIDKAQLLISNESGPVHIAVAVNTPFVCISNGNHYKRFHPYPEYLFKEGIYVYHQELNYANKTELAYWYKFQSHLNINEIDIEDVRNAVLELTKSTNQ